MVLEVHRILTSGTYDERRFLENGERPGEYKKHDYITGKNEVGARQTVWRRTWPVCWRKSANTVEWT